MARQLLYIMEELDVTVSFFINDDVMKQGRQVAGKKIILSKHLLEMAQKEKVNVILVSIDEGFIAEKLVAQPLFIFRAYGLCIEQY